MTDEVIGGRYRLLEIVGEGGMGRVWRAHDELLQRVVAVKEVTFLGPQVVREARAAARLDHPGVVQVFDVTWYRDRSWIVMEYVPSRSLQQAVRDDGPLPPREVARIGSQVLAALRSAHAAGVLHRDVKPGNVLLAADGRVVLSDFGLATFGERDQGPDPLMGSPLFVAPERVRGAEAGPEADLWSLGATMYAAVEGRAPFDRGDTDESLRALLDEEPHPVRRAGPLGPLLLDLLDKDPADRPTAAETEARLRDTGIWRGRATVAAPPRRRPAARYVVAGAAV
ncbi:serine/threonine-protein kinase, partial [Actinoplanes sp. NPDC049596]